MPPRHILITGGSRGIGLAIAHLFAKTGYRCTLISRSEADLKTAVGSLTPLPPTYKHGYIAASISAPGFWSTGGEGGGTFSRFMSRPRRDDGQDASRVDVLVNCAGITQASLFTRTSESDIQAILNTNLTSVMLGTRFLLRHGYLRKLSARGGGKEEEGGQMEKGPVVINLASLLGVSGGYGAVAYAASKAGMLGFTRALASEYASHGVRVNAIVPGYVDTGMTQNLNEPSLSQRIPLGRFGTPQEIASAALFLAENEYAHNCVLNLDGGLSAV